MFKGSVVRPDIKTLDVLKQGQGHMGTFGFLFAAVLVSILSFSLGLLQRRPASRRALVPLALVRRSSVGTSEVAA
jgi:hypothetical protein